MRHLNLNSELRVQRNLICAIGRGQKLMLVVCLAVTLVVLSRVVRLLRMASRNRKPDHEMHEPSRPANSCTFLLFSTLRPIRELDRD